jgi:hypothetical protein
MMGTKNSGEAAGFEFVLGSQKRITDRREVILENKKATQIGSL